MTKYSAQQFIDAIEGTGGIIWQIANNVGCAWDTAKKYIDKHPSVRRAWENERKRVVDKAKHNIVGEIEKGDVQLSKWFVTVLDKDFRPPQRHEVAVSGETNIVVKWADANGNGEAAEST